VLQLTSSATVPGCLAKTFQDTITPSACIGLKSGTMIQFVSVSRFARSLVSSHPVVNTATQCNRNSFIQLSTVSYNFLLVSCCCIAFACNTRHYVKQSSSIRIICIIFLESHARILTYGTLSYVNHYCGSIFSARAGL